MGTTRELLHRVGWSYTEAARRLGVQRRTVERWAAGDYAPPPAVLAWLGDCATAIEDRPPPQRKG